MSTEQGENTEAGQEVELISDGESLVVIGKDRRSVEHFMRAAGLLDRAREFGSEDLGPVLRSSAEAVKTVSEAMAWSALRVKITPGSAESIRSSASPTAVAWRGMRDGGHPWLNRGLAQDRHHRQREGFESRNARRRRLLLPRSPPQGSGIRQSRVMMEHAPEECRQSVLGAWGPVPHRLRAPAYLCA